MTSIQYHVQCQFPKSSYWTNTAPPFEDEDEAVNFLDEMLITDDSGYDGCTFRVLKTVYTESVITKKVRHSQQHSTNS